MATIIIAILVLLALIVLKAILSTQNKILKELKNIHIPEPQIPPAKEFSLDLNPVVEAIKENKPSANITAELLQSVVNTQNDLVKLLQETSTLMRVNQAEFQSGLQAFHASIDKLLSQIPNGEKELDAQKEFVQKFEAAFVNVQEKAAEAMNENSLRLQEILTEFLSKEQKG